MYEKVTKGFLVKVKPVFLDEQSRPAESRFFWAYTIIIENKGTLHATLRTRHWEITDGNGRKQVVDGDGVVGEQPVFRPGTVFQYTSGCPLSTASGVMVGTYGMLTQTGEPFDIDIPAFSLDSPYDRHSVN